MKGRWLILTVFIVSGVLLLEAGCEEQERVGTAGRYEPEWRPLRPRIAVPRTQTIPKARRGAPQIIIIQSPNLARQRNVCLYKATIRQGLRFH